MLSSSFPSFLPTFLPVPFQQPLSWDTVPWIGSVSARFGSCGIGSSAATGLGVLFLVLSSSQARGETCKINKYISYVRFWMVTLTTALTLNHNDWRAALDHQDTYFHVVIFPNHRRFLWFVVSNQHYQYTKLSSLDLYPVYGCGDCVPQEKGNSYPPYMEDWLLRGKSRKDVLSYVHISVYLLDCLGLTLNRKSALITIQKI